MEYLRFERVFDFADVPGDWRLVRLTLDWSGRPLLLFAEGKPLEPNFHKDMDAWSRWYRTPPKAHHVVYWEANRLRSVAFDSSVGPSTFHVQPFENGWLLGERRGGRGTVYNANGAVRFILDLGDASEDLQTTPDGRIWVSYFDEGVFGTGIGQQGLICFDGAGQHLFKYADFAEQEGLPMICDCYAINVDEGGVVWLNYYTDFPLVRLNGYKVDKVWRGFGHMGKSFAMLGNEAVYISDGRLVGVSLTATTHAEPTMKTLEDNEGRVLRPNSQRYADVAGRGAVLAINTGDTIYSTNGMA
jgi:hypothetical protein